MQILKVEADPADGIGAGADGVGAGLGRAAVDDVGGILTAGAATCQLNCLISRSLDRIHLISILH